MRTKAIDISVYQSSTDYEALIDETARRLRETLDDFGVDATEGGLFDLMIELLLQTKRFKVKRGNLKPRVNERALRKIARFLLEQRGASAKEAAKQVAEQEGLNQGSLEKEWCMLPKAKQISLQSAIDTELPETFLRAVTLRNALQDALLRLRAEDSAR